MSQSVGTMQHVLRRWLPLLLLALLALLASGCASGNGSDTTAASPGAAVVTKVVDGDTLRVRIDGVEDRVRLIGIDTPETHGRGGLRECFGKEASAFLARLVPPGTEVRLVRDVEPRDRYQRLLAYVYRARDDLFVNLHLAEQGYAAAYTYPPNVAHADELVAAAAAARAANLGLWGACGGPDTRLE